jgi:hypothetical protein
MLVLVIGAYTGAIQVVLATRPSYEEDDMLLLDLIDSSAVTQAFMHLIVPSVMLHIHRIPLCVRGIPEALIFWVKPRSTAWFFEFIMYEYTDDRWLEHFIVTKYTVFGLCRRLYNRIAKMCTRYRESVPIEARICVALYKLVHGCTMLDVSKKIAIGKSTAGLILREFTSAVNEEFKVLIRWNSGRRMHMNMLDFKSLSGLPSIHGALDGTQFEILKPRGALCPEDYFYHKKSQYSMVA